MPDTEQPYTVSTYQRHGRPEQALLVLPPGEDPPLSIICPNDHRRWWREDTQPHTTPIHQPTPHHPTTTTDP